MTSTTGRPPAAPTGVLPGNDLSGDVSGAPGANHVDSLSGPGSGVPIRALAPLALEESGTTLPSIGMVRFPRPADGGQDLLR
jgi:hypothetical protein